MVVGFMLDEQRENAVLIRKLRPEWMNGLLNGVGGKIEKGESPSNAMAREYEEETGVVTEAFGWLPFLTIDGSSENFKIYYFIAIGDISTVQTVEEEAIEVTPINDITLLRKDIVENLTWILGLGMDVARDGRPRNAYVYH